MVHIQSSQDNEITLTLTFLLETQRTIRVEVPFKLYTTRVGGNLEAHLTNMHPRVFFRRKKQSGGHLLLLRQTFDVHHVVHRLLSRRLLVMARGSRRGHLWIIEKWRWWWSEKSYRHICLTIYPQTVIAGGGCNEIFGDASNVNSNRRSCDTNLIIYIYI